MMPSPHEALKPHTGSRSFLTQTEPTVNSLASQSRGLETFADDDDSSLEDDDPGSTESIELLESSDSSGTLVIFRLSSLQAVSETIEIAAIAAIAQT